MRVNQRLSLPSRIGLSVAGVLGLGLLTAGSASALNDGDPCGPLWTEATAPIVSFTVAPASVSTSELIEFDASASQQGTADKWTFVSADNACEPTSTVVDPIASYTWDFGDGSQPETDPAPTNFAAHTYAKANAGGYPVTLTVTEVICPSGPGSCFTGQTTVPVTVQDRPPAASFTAPANALTGPAVSFDASASADSDGAIVDYHWAFGDSQTQDTTSPTTFHRYRSTGPKTVTLSVTDDSGSTAQATHTVSVSHLAPVASFSAPKSVSTGQAASFDASASSDPDGTITSYRWDFGDGTTLTTAAPRTSHVYRRSGTWAVTLTVVDDSASTNLSRHAVTVTDRSPAASFAAGPTVAAGRAARFDASGSSDPDGTITRYSWDFGDGTAQTTARPSVTHTYRKAGTKTVTLTVTDDQDNTNRAQHTITVLVGRCIVPRLVGTKLAQARTLLRSGNCRLGTVRHKHASPRKHGRVIHQGVRPGTIRSPGAAVTVTVGN